MRHVGLSRHVRAADQLQRTPAAAAVAPQPLPPGSPGRVAPAGVGIADTAEITFLVIGDTGGVMDPNPQLAVTGALEARAAAAPKPAFVWHVGDVVYFFGDEAQYGAQFYEPYTHLQLPIVGIPGNHDGDTSDDPTRAPLDAWIENFCAAQPVLPPAYEEYGRDVQTQPWCDWTLELEAATIVGLYSNVPDGGVLSPPQVQWLAGELKAAPAARPLIVSLHHPAYSVDAFHGGSARMGTALDQAFASAGRTPELVLSGHVHDYQRFTRTLNGKPVTYVVQGNSGYHNLHHFALGTKPGEAVAGDVTFDAGDDKNWGFLELTAGGGKLSGSYTSVSRAGQATAGADTFTITAQ